MILKFNEITEMSFRLKQTFNLQRQFRDKQSSECIGSSQKEKKGYGVEEAGRVDARYYESGKREY